MRLLLAVALAIALEACAPRTLRTQLCMQPMPGLQACSYHYEGDDE